MELQDRRSYFRQAATWMVGLGVGVIVPAADYVLNPTMNTTAICVFGGAGVLALGVAGWVFTETLIK